MASPLLSLDHTQWEALCDGCGRCCVVKLENEDTGKIHYTNVACRYLETETCRCTDYANRCSINPECVKLSPNDLSILDIMPTTCAYRLKHENRSIDVDISLLKVAHRVIPEADVQDDQLPDYIVDWITCETED